MRELNRYASGLSPEVQNMITENQRIAQETIRQRILDVRTRVIRLYLQRHPEHARSLYGYGDIGSWALQQRDRLPTAEMDVDWTIFGADPEATAELRNLYNQELLRDLAGDNPEGLQLVRDFDIVVTAEGHEAQSHVFETRGGVDWAKRNMRRVTILNPDGTERTYDLARGQDPVFELAMAQNLADLRSAATRGGNYGELFDANGNLRPQERDPPRALGPLHQPVRGRRLLHQQAKHCGGWLL